VEYDGPHSGRFHYTPYRYGRGVTLRTNWMVPMSVTRVNRGTKRLGDILVERELLSEDDLLRALEYQSQNGSKLGESLLKIGALTHEQLAEGLAAQKRLSVIPLNEVYPNPRAVSLLSEKFIRNRQVLPVDFEQDSLILAMVNPLDVVTIDDVRVIAGYPVLPVVATLPSFEEAVDYFFSDKGVLDTADDGDLESGPGQAAEQRREAEDGSVVTLVNDILDGAIKRRASDIHFEPQEDHLAVRVRVDGVLHNLTEVPSALAGGLVSRIKIMGDLDIAERRLPQDGRAGYRNSDQTVDLRIATLPTVFGENVTLRILDESMFEINLTSLGMQEEELEVLRRALGRPYGQILITGPTGSGKSTTLYSALEELNRPEVKIYTVEDPVERKIPGVLQSQVRHKIGLTFARVLRSLVRSDPDIIMLGEIRDLETAMIATEASLTGHLLLSTLHTNDAPSAITRLVEMGVPPYLIASSLECVVAQRLARRLCPRCSREVRLSKEDKSPGERELLGDGEFLISEPVGCPRCFGTGYSGRLGLFEVLPITPEVRKQILKGAGDEQIRRQARKAGMVPLREAGLRRVLSGETSVAEVLRVTA